MAKVKQVIEYFLYSNKTWEKEETVLEVDLNLFPEFFANFVKVEEAYVRLKCGNSHSHGKEDWSSMEDHRGQRLCEEYKNFDGNSGRVTSEDHSFKCSLCAKCFEKSNDLKRHMLTHTGETPFKCTHCWK